MSVQAETGGAGHQYSVGVMLTNVEEKNLAEFRETVQRATDQFEDFLAEKVNLQIQLFEFAGPHLTPSGGGYSPLDFLNIGISEKIERQIDFLLIVTEVDLAASTMTYVLALPSQLTNVGIISNKRLSPSFWTGEENRGRQTNRLVILMLHTFCHLLNLYHSPDPQNIMHDFSRVEDLDQMQTLTSQQAQHLQRNLKYESHSQVRHGNKIGFFIRAVLRNWRSIRHAVYRANPFRLVTKLPTMIATALSVIIVLFFSAETWDVAGTVELYQLLLFALVAIVTSIIVMNRVVAINITYSRKNRLSEAMIVTSSATLLSLFLTHLILFMAIFILIYLAAVTIFPQPLMRTWPTHNQTVAFLDHISLSVFLASMGILAGSLGGRADSRDVIRKILFLDEET